MELQTPHHVLPSGAVNRSGPFTLRLGAEEGSGRHRVLALNVCGDTECL